jgi:hypothetical protein
MAADKSAMGYMLDPLSHVGWGLQSTENEDPILASSHQYCVGTVHVGIGEAPVSFATARVRKRSRVIIMDGRTK